jgi:hypothetical protein
VKGGIRVGVGTKFLYDGETLTIIEMFPAGRGNEVLVEDRGGKRRYWLALRELLASGRAMVLTHEAGPRSNDPIELASVILSSLDDAARAAVAERAGHVREVLTGYKCGSAELALPGEPRPEYAPQTQLNTRYNTKAREKSPHHFAVGTCLPRSR